MVKFQGEGWTTIWKPKQLLLELILTSKVEDASARAAEMLDLLLFYYSESNQEQFSVMVNLMEQDCGDDTFICLMNIVLWAVDSNMATLQKLWAQKLNLSDRCMPLVQELIIKCMGAVLEVHLSHNQITENGAAIFFDQRVLHYYPTFDHKRGCEALGFGVGCWISETWV
mmetsp:Transcript_4189/g.6604  ORF Transcript_4189/g.6604 Transcript_4189/m.6604 type:complete len:170 (+) Transcript_4189:203-712(+)